MSRHVIEEKYRGRRLRAHGAADEESEDKFSEQRAGIPGLSSIADKLGYKILLKLRTDPGDVFAKLRLAEVGVKLNDNPTFFKWLKYVSMYRTKNSFSDSTLYELLRKTKSEDELVTFFQSMRKVPGMKDTAEALQRLMAWRSTSSREFMNEAWLKFQETPKEVFRILHVGDDILEPSNPALIQWLQYTDLGGVNLKYADVTKTSSQLQWQLRDHCWQTILFVLQYSLPAAL